MLPHQVVEVGYAAGNGLKYLVIRLDDAITRLQLEALRPDMSELVEAAGAGGDVRGIIVTAKGSGGYDFFSRFFAPWCGIPEDHVTGSAHAVLAPYWTARLPQHVASGMSARQVSSRGGDLTVRVEKGKVVVSGQAFVVIRGSFRVE